MAISKVRKLKEVVVYDIKDGAIENLRKNLIKERIKIKKEKLEGVCQKDILVTVTPTKKPIIKSQWILPGTHINAVGADAPGKEELEPDILKRAKVVVDSWEQASHSGEINVPVSKGIITKKDIIASLGEVVSGRKQGRKNDKEITLFDSTGLAIQDLYVANLVYKLARVRKVGKVINIFN